MILGHFPDRAERKGECVMCKSRHGKRRDTMCVFRVCVILWRAVRVDSVLGNTTH